MSSINEAYARIDYATILDLQNKVIALEEIVKSYTNDSLSNINGNKLNVRGTKIFADAISVEAKESKINVIFGSNFFSTRPIITATLRDTNNKLASGTEIPVVMVTYVDRTKATLLIKRKKETPLILYVIAIGESAD